MIQKSNEFTTILAIDSATGPCSAAVWAHGKVVAYGEELQSTKQSKRLLPMVEEVLAKAGLAYSDLCAVAVTVGPGSFTGIRIALAAARGIGFAANIPVLGFSALEVLALANKGKATTAIINAGKGEVVVQEFDADMQPLSQPSLKPIPAEHDFSYPRADVLAELAATHPARAVAATPYYVRPPDAKTTQELISDRS